MTKIPELGLYKFAEETWLNFIQDDTLEIEFKFQSITSGFTIYFNISSK